MYAVRCKRVVRTGAPHRSNVVTWLTGGTHLRFMFEGQKCCDANKALWNSTGWGWNMQAHVLVSENDPQFLVDWLHDNGGRVFSEAHVTQSLAESLEIMRDLERTEVWQRSGCLLWIFTMIRCNHTHTRTCKLVSRTPHWFMCVCFVCVASGRLCVLPRHAELVPPPPCNPGRQTPSVNQQRQSHLQEPLDVCEIQPARHVSPFCVPATVC